MEKGLWVHAEKTKVMICGTDLNLLQSSCEFPMRCLSNRSRLTAASTAVTNKHWVHLKRRRLQRLTPNPD